MYAAIATAPISGFPSGSSRPAARAAASSPAGSCARAAAPATCRRAARIRARRSDFESATDAIMHHCRQWGNPAVIVRGMTKLQDSAARCGPGWRGRAERAGG